MSKPLMLRLLNAGYSIEQMFHPQFGSDLYVYVNPTTTAVIQEWCAENQYEMNWHCPIFEDQIAGMKMYNCAFQYNRGIPLWYQFEDIPLNPETECTETAWQGFPSGTHREEIWHWFEKHFGLSVNDLLYRGE